MRPASRRWRRASARYARSAGWSSRARLACVDFRRPRPGRPGGVRFLFDVGALPDAQLAAITLQAAEIAAHRLVEPFRSLELPSGPLRRRVSAILAAEVASISRRVAR